MVVVPMTRILGKTVVSVTEMTVVPGISRSISSKVAVIDQVAEFLDQGFFPFKVMATSWRPPLRGKPPWMADGIEP
jgi:hypothetical protein